MMKDPIAYQCQWCGNHVPDMTWEDILGMLRTYREINGCHAFSTIQAALDITPNCMDYWFTKGTQPNYTRAVALAQHLKQELSKVTPEQREKFIHQYRKAI